MLAMARAISSILTAEYLTKPLKCHKYDLGDGNVYIGIVPATGVLCLTEQSFIPPFMPEQNLMVPWTGWG